MVLFGVFLATADVLQRKAPPASSTLSTASAAYMYTEHHTLIWLALGLSFFAVNCSCSARPDGDSTTSKAAMAHHTVLRSTGGAIFLFIILPLRCSYSCILPAEVLRKHSVPPR